MVEPPEHAVCPVVLLEAVVGVVLAPGGVRLGRRGPAERHGRRYGGLRPILRLVLALRLLCLEGSDLKSAKS